MHPAPRSAGANEYRASTAAAAVRLYALQALGQLEPDVLEHYKDNVSEMTNDKDLRIGNASHDVLNGKVRKKPPAIFREETQASVHTIAMASLMIYLYERRLLRNIYGRDMYVCDRD